MKTLRFPADARVGIYPFTRQGDGDELVIGRPDTGTFLALPRDAVEILDVLGQGKTVGEAQDIYQSRYDERPNLESLLTVLEQKGLVSLTTHGEPADWALQATAGVPGPIRYHFTSFPRPLARALFSPIALLLSGVLILLAVVGVIWEPTIFPARDALFFKESMTLKMLILTIFSFVIVFFHEVGHLIAVRAAGVDSRLGIGNRLWMLVVETDMTGLWAVSKRQRYLPIIAGPIVDASSVSLVLLILLADRRSWLSLSPFTNEILSGAALIYLLGLVWQCFLFVRTDFYYVLTNFYDCRNLLRDTEIYLHNQLVHLAPWMKRHDQSAVPRAELRVIRNYSLVWVLGRVLALGVFFTVVIPMLSLYTRSVGDAFRTGYAANPYRFFDALMIAIFGLVPLLIGLGMWSKKLIQRWGNAT